MFSKGSPSRFETQVHLGLLVIIFVLISLNFISNYITYNARTTEKKALAANLHTSAIAISRILPDQTPNPPAEVLDGYKKEYRLSKVIVIPSQPENSSREARRQWFIDFAYRLPTTQVPDIARKILGAEYNTLTRGENEEFFYVYPVPSRGGKYLLILSVSSADLAYLEDSADLILTITVVSTLLIVFTYFLLARYIFRPFRKLRQQALDSGRVVSRASNEAEAVAEDYRSAIAELKEKEQKLIELNREISRRATSLEQFNAYLLKSTNSGIVTFDREGRIFSINDAAAKNLEIDPGEYVGALGNQLFAPESELGQALQVVIEKGENQPYKETELTIAGQNKKAVGYSVSTVSDDRQQPIGASMVITDLNEIIHLRQELEAKNRLAALGEMSGGLAHQLRNSIGSIVGFSNLLKKQLAKAEIESDYFDELFSEVKQTESLVKRFLSFARPLEFESEECNLAELVKVVVADYNQNIAAKLTEGFNPIVFSGQPNTVKYSADPLLLKQALNNILDNAVSACSGGDGEVAVKIESNETTAVIAISDNGTGIPEDKLDKVFTPFFSSKPSGTGLGLPLAGKIIDLHGGHITIESKVGAGTTFRIHLPLRVQSEPVAAGR